MKFNRLGQTGLYVSEICMGTWGFSGRNYFGGAIGTLDQKTATGFIGRALEAKVNFIDTANVYSFGDSETMTGQALKDLGVKRSDVVLATKVFGRMGPGPNDMGASRGHIMDSVALSLERLQTDHIDLYQIHHSDPITTLDETMRALDDLVRQGIVRYVGVSNWEAWKIMKANGIAEHRGLSRIVTNQVYYSIAGRDIEQEMAPMMQDQDVGCLVWSPLSGGYMAGKYTAGDGVVPDAGRRAKFDFPPVDKEKADRTVLVMREIGKKHGVSVATVGLTWVRQKPFITSTIIGATTMEQLNDNLKSVDFTLSADEMARLDEVSADKTQYPYWMISRNNTTRVPTGAPITVPGSVPPKN
jgi:aryl-alcohol dehydrogenase-like predicted oxidoreductase